MADDIPPLPAGASNNPAAPPPTSTPAPAGAIAAAPMNHPPIALETPAPTKEMPPAPVIAPKQAEVKDTFRELIETVVFVVVLVLMLKTFLAEAFVIPTGSMANTLLGYHYKITCQQCGYVNWVNASAEAEPQDPKRRPRIVRCECINCKFINEVAQPEPVRGGER